MSGLDSALEEMFRRVVREELAAAGIGRVSAPAGADWLTQEQAAELLGVDVRTIRRFTRSGELAASRVGRSPRYARGELLAFLQRQRGASGDGG